MDVLEVRAKALELAIKYFEYTETNIDDLSAIEKIADRFVGYINNTVEV